MIPELERGAALACVNGCPEFAVVGLREKRVDAIVEMGILLMELCHLVAELVGGDAVSVPHFDVVRFDDFVELHEAMLCAEDADVFVARHCASGA